MRANLYRLIILAIALAVFAAVAIRFARRSPRPVASPSVAESTQHTSSPPPATARPGSSTTSSVPSVPAAAPSAPAAPPFAPGSRQAATQPVRPLPPVGPPDQEALLEIDQVNLMIRDYRSLTGENPVGTNAEIMAATMGDNPKQAKLGPPDGAKLNEKGELLDRWGTPYFFHQLSRNHMEIRSAGPDKVMWTADDPVIK